MEHCLNHPEAGRSESQSMVIFFQDRIKRDPDTSTCSSHNEQKEGACYYLVLICRNFNKMIGSI